MTPSGPCLDDETLLALVERRVPSAERDRVEAHLEECAKCRQVAAASAALVTSSITEFAEPERPQGASLGILSKGSVVGRYVVLEVVGRGGMGVVYAAYDPELNRKVALKLLRGSNAGDTVQARLIREAQAMARLSHPNVTAVYDVGAFQGSVFIAMELVSGMTMREWLRAEPRTWRDILAYFVFAGRGLAAAHAAGLIHRDFKPENVLISQDGRVRVTDFGLARDEAAPTEPAPELGLAAPGPATALASSQLTAVGAVVGTPPYMAPEQHRGDEIDAKADQFSFCVSLYEALYGERPFWGSSISELRRSVLDGVRAPPKGSRVPRWVRRALLRGLSLSPSDRFPSMTALLSELDPRPRTARMRAAVALGAGVLLLAGAAAVLRQVRQAPPLCEGSERHLAGLWEAPVKESIHRAFTATGRPYAEASWTRTSAALDAYAARWVASHREACEATRLRGEQSEEVLTLRMVCLEERRQELAALASLLARADGQAVADAPRSTAQLSPVSECEDLQGLTAAVRPPSDPNVRRQVEVVRQSLAEARALYHLGQYAAGLKAAAAVVEAAQPLHYRPLDAEALLLLGSIQDMGDQPKAAEETLQRALLAAAEGHHDRLSAEIWVKLIGVLGVYQTKYEAGLLAARQAEAAIARIGGDPALTSQMLDLLGGVHTGQGRYDAAIADFQKAIELAEKTFGPEDIRVVRPLTHLASVHRARGFPSEAITLQERTVDLLIRLYGPEHPSVADLLFNMSNALADLDRPAEALQRGQQALEIYEKVYGPEHVSVARVHNGLCATLWKLGKYDESLEHIQRALELRKKLLGPEHSDVAVSLSHLASVYVLQGRHREALATWQKAFAIFEKAYGPNHPEVGTRLVFGAGLLARNGKLREALAMAARGVAIFEASPQVGGTRLARALTVRGEQELALGQTRQAVASLERALALHESNAQAPQEQALTKFVLARALWPTGKKNRALALAEEARATFSDGSGQSADELSRVNRWLAQHRRRDR